MVKFIQKKNGVLRIRFVGNKFDRQTLRETRNKSGINAAFMEATESYWTNGWGVHIADELGQMSSCLVIAHDSTVEDDGSITLTGKTWSNNHNYAIVDEIEEMLKKGYVDFYSWENFSEPETFKVLR
jgi:hypothetical protein